ncbi:MULTISPECIES: hypothetical protein [unclassified Pseudomonas]|uniref:hypothetical protein n=1 Tax=unclassified Pseudomonas TaxID=196821 RepID=UPI000C86A36A|nr:MULTISPECIES: hypothetical protein [unclassified Pseudomonas]PMU16559.1 hypothetical protein C1X90_27430 [Pseudomonas sp. GP01-A9]PMU23505.1 hypothetical protein C1X88_27090 [Pseudomonas sp. GP01-A13]PMU33714.1 hypothetical protein C1X89_26935 [Pseudomonas sp. GP01-A8]PMU48617.1 hypothetical protein C1X85_29610 [Pseudomonas sp. GP01-A6]PMU48826.1 hypothetical protein C1X87_18955 [Pseudomonas sp. GP01-A14]
MNELLLRCHTRIVDGFRVDQETGEIYGEYITTPYAPLAEDYEIPRSVKADARDLYLVGPEYHTVADDFAPTAVPEGVIDLDTIRGKRGPKPKVFINTLAPFIQAAHSERMQWLDDFVYGACYTSGETSNGTLNVSPSDVRRVCMLPVISTETVRSVIRTRSFEPASERQARRIAKAAKFAIGGIDLYLSRNLSVMERLKYEVDFIAAYYGPDADEMSA